MLRWRSRTLPGRGFAVALASMILIQFCLVPGWAASLDEGCCADLEERIAELEATTARRGNRKVSLQLYGQVNRAVMAWDDTVERNAYVVDNETSSTRFGFLGEALIDPGRTAGYRVEIELTDSASNEVSAESDEGFANTNRLQIRQSYWFLEDSTLGRVSAGFQSPATDDITIINLGSRMSDGALHYNNNFTLRMASPMVFNVTWGDLAHTVDSFRGNFVRYNSPTIHGFLLSAAWGEDDVWDAAVRYSAVWNSVRVAAGIGYMDDQERDFRDVRGSASLIHEPTGLYVLFAGGVRDDDNVQLDVERDGNFYFTQLGVSARYLPFGTTTLYGEYGHYDDFSVGQDFAANLTGMKDTRWALTNSEVERWGLGIEQGFDNAGLLLYGQFHHYEADFSGAKCEGLLNFGGPCLLAAPDPKRKDFSPEPWQAAVVGARIPF